MVYIEEVVNIVVFGVDIGCEVCVIFWLIDIY